MITKTARLAAATLLASICLSYAEQPAKPEYLPGGPLAGLVLPKSKQNTGPGPEMELHPGSVEHWRAYFMKYLTTRSFFDQQSQLKNWVAPEIPGAKPSQVEQYASPVYRQPDSGDAKDTGKKLDPVPVIRCKVGDPAFKLDLGTLEPGMYAVRVIGAVETAKLRRVREPLFLSMKVNDGLKGEVNSYRIRPGYVDEFYSVGDFYFHAPEKRAYTAELSLDQGTTIELLVHNITLDDVLAGTTRRAIKTRRTLTTDDEIEAIKAEVSESAIKAVEMEKPYTPEERLARDEAIWNRIPPLNTPVQWLDGVGLDPADLGTADMTMEQIEEKYGKWESAGGRETTNMNPTLGVMSRDPELQNAFLVNAKLGLTYTMDDLRARKSLPDPYPFKDDGAGLYFPDPKDVTKGRAFFPIARELGRRYRQNTSPAGNAAAIWLKTGNEDIARDGAVSLLRAAMQFPSIDSGNFLQNGVFMPQAQGRDLFCRQRADAANWLSHYPLYMDSVRDYDLLFDYIKGNEELAQSIHRFVPWVKTSQDLIELLDVYLLQTTAKRILRYQYYSNPTEITNATIALGDTTVTDPWMEWQFSRTFVYPLNTAGLPDLLISGQDREGVQYIGSSYYGQGQGSRRLAETLDRYIALGGNPKFQLSDPKIFPKALAQCYWQFEQMIGGADLPRIGDVAGPDKSPFGHMSPFMDGAVRSGWKWSGDPKFAWIVKNVFGQGDESAEDWTKLEAAAATVKRAPWLDLKSRHVENWFTALETGLQHDDYRFRRTAYLRTGIGSGHAHADTLDLQFFAHGLPMTIDGGQRSGYSKPNDKFSRIHNTVEVNGAGNSEYGLQSYGWTTALSDAPGARYMQVTADPPDGAKIFRRQLALIDVDEGKGSEPLTTDQQKPRAVLKAGVVTGNSYIFDVFRVSGGSQHTYCFHGPVNEDFQWNAANVKPVETPAKEARVPGSDSEYLWMFASSPESKAVGDAPETFQATWKYLRDGKFGSEQQMLGKNFEPASPPKFTRLTLLGSKDLRALKADMVCSKDRLVYRFTNTMLQRKDAGGKLESAFTAIIEPYAGEPFIASSKLLPIADNEDDALRAVAVEVLTKNGHTDMVFADGRPEKTRQISSLKSQVSGEFACLSKDKDGLRLATLTGGTLLQSPDVTLAVARREHTATIIKVDYPNKTLWTDKPLPAACAGRVVEIGLPGSPLAYTMATIQPDGPGSRVTFTRGADFYSARITAFLPDRPGVNGGLDLPPGRSTEGMTLSNDTLTKFWRLKKRGDGCNFPVDAPLAEADFGPSKVMRVWEYGVGDTLRLPGMVAVNRVDGGGYEIRGDVDVEVTLGTINRKISADEFAKDDVVKLK